MRQGANRKIMTRYISNYIRNYFFCEQRSIMTKIVFIEMSLCDLGRIARPKFYFIAKAIQPLLLVGEDAAKLIHFF